MVKKFVFITLTVLLSLSCNTNELEFDNIQIPPLSGTFSLPLGQVTYTMRELIEQQDDSLLGLEVDEDSLITLMYFDSIGYQSDTDFVQIQDTTYANSVNLGAEVPAAGPATIPLDQEFVFNYDPEDSNDVVDSIFYATGEVTVDVSTTIGADLDYTFTLNNFVTVTNEIPLELTGSIAGPGSNTSVRSLLNHKLVIAGTNNQFLTDFVGSIELDAGENFNGTEEITFDLSFANQTFSVIYGKFGQDTVQVGQETLDIELFQEVGEQGLFFGNPTIRFFFENTIGIPIGMDFSTLFGDDGEGGTQTFLEGDIVDNIPTIAIGDVNNPGEVARDTIEINSTNSTLVDLLATSPARLGFDVQGISNPNDPTAINYITDFNQITASIAIEVPMEVKLQDMQQTIDIDLGDGLDISNVDSAVMRVLTVNELPFSGLMDINVKDSTLRRADNSRPEGDSTLYSVVDNLVLAAPFINVNGFVTDPNGNSVDVPISAAGIEALGSGTHIELLVTLNTPGSLNSRDIFVKILSTYALEVSVGLRGTVNVDL